MTIEWATFIAELASNPVLVAVTLLNIGVIVVNGATDAPNAIATVVSTRAMKPKFAILMAAVCNFLGLLLVSLVTSAVAHTIFNMVDFGGNSQQALIALTAAMIAIIVWGAAAWWFGIPTSQSHSLIAGLTGAAIALQGGFGAINGGEWMKVVYGILLSTLLGFFLGWANSKIVGRVCRNMDRKRTTKVFRWAQVASGAGVAFMHGAQDSQKFMSIFVLAITLATGVVHVRRPAGFHDAHEHHGHHGRGRRQAQERREMGHRRRHGEDMGAHVPRMRPARVRIRPFVPVLLVKGEFNVQEAQVRLL